MKHAAHIQMLANEFCRGAEKYSPRLRLTSRDESSVKKISTTRAFINPNGSYSLIDNQEMHVPVNVDLESVRSEFNEEIAEMTARHAISVKTGFFMPNDHHLKYIPAFQVTADEQNFLFTIGTYAVLCFEPRPRLPELSKKQQDREASTYPGGKHDMYIDGDISFWVEKKDDLYIVSRPIHMENARIADGSLGRLLQTLEKR